MSGGACLVSRVPLNLYSTYPIIIIGYVVDLKLQLHVKEKETSGVTIILCPFSKFDLNNYCN